MSLWRGKRKIGRIAGAELGYRSFRGQAMTIRATGVLKRSNGLWFASLGWTGGAPVPTCCDSCLRMISIDVLDGSWHGRAIAPTRISVLKANHA